MKYLLIFSIVFLSSCSKEYKAPVFWDVKIKHTLTATGLNLEAIAYPSTGVTYIWYVNDFRLDGKTVQAGIAARYYIQLAVIDNKGNSIAEYLTVVR